MTDYCLPVTYKCNWKCDYCIVDTHNQPDITDKKLDLLISEIPRGSEVNISGGEPGLLSLTKINEILQKLKNKDCHPISVMTNGLFLDRYYNEMYDIIDEFNYHCSEDFIKDPVIYNDPDSKINYLAVVTDNNLIHLDKFMSTYKGDNLLLIKDKSLSILSGMKIYMKYKHILDKKSITNLLEDIKTVDNDIIKL
jgi:organic radical activating enzyme